MTGRFTLVLAVLFLATAFGVERYCAKHYDDMIARKRQLKERVEEMLARSAKAPAEIERAKQLIAAADTMAARVKWDSDSTNLLKWFAEMASATGAKLQNARVVATDKGNETFAGGEYKSVRFDIAVQGEYAPLAEYVHKVESAPMPMAIETLTMEADRMNTGAGDMKLTVAAVYPTPAEEKAAAARLAELKAEQDRAAKGKRR